MFLWSPTDWIHESQENNGEDYLVGGIPTPEKNMKVSWDYEIPN